MKCPQCKSPLQEKTYEGVKIDCCGNCAGTWLDQGELVQILEIREKSLSDGLNVAVKNNPNQAGIPASEIESVELCPKCSTALLAVNYNYSSGVIIDRCPNGDGVWLNGTELEKIQTHHEFWEEKAKREGKQWSEKALNESIIADEMHQARLDSSGKKMEGRILPFLYRMNRKG